MRTVQKEIREELTEMKERGLRFVILNGFRENIEYISSLRNLKKVEDGVYETINEA